MKYYQHHIGDYIKDTAHLTVLEDGIYRRLIDLYYSRDGEIPEDVKQISRLIGARTRKDVETTSKILQEFFKNKSGKWTHIRCDKEIAKSKAFIKDGKRGAKIRWGNRAPRQEKNSPPTQTPMLTNNHKPITNIYIGKNETQKTASPIEKKEEEKPNFTDVRDKIAEGMSFKTTRGITKPWQEEAFRYATELGMELDDAQKGRWIKLFKETHTLRPYMRKNLQIAYSFLSDLSSFRALDTESKMRYFFNIFYKGPPQNAPITNSFAQP